MEQKIAVGIVIRADGTVPFDEGVHPDIKARIIAHLVEHGHRMQPVHGTGHYRIKDFKGHPRRQ